jgi:YggT family protein
MLLIRDAILIVIEVMKYAIFISVLMSWIPQARESKFAEVLRQLTEPVLGPVRKLTSKAMGGKPMMLDFSPLIAIVLLELIGGIVSRIFR